MRPAQQPHWRSGLAAWWHNVHGRRAHPAPVTLSRYVDDDLPLPEWVAVDGHVRECGPCRRMLESLAQTIGGLRTLRMREASPHTERIIAALAQIALPVPWRDRARAALRYCLRRSQLRLTVPIGLLVGATLTLLNMGGPLLRGEIDLAMAAACALEFVLPFVAMNVILLVVARGQWLRSAPRSLR